MKETITARLYALEYQGTAHELTAESAGDLAEQVQRITASKPAASLARLAWQADRADLSAGGVRLLAVGEIVRRTWATVSATRPGRAAQQE